MQLISILSLSLFTGMAACFPTSNAVLPASIERRDNCKHNSPLSIYLQITANILALLQVPRTQARMLEPCASIRPLIVRCLDPHSTITLPLLHPTTNLDDFRHCKLLGSTR